MLHNKAHIVCTILELCFIIIPGLNLEERFWVRNSELEPSEGTFEDLPPEEETSEVICNRTALYKPQVTLSNILWKSSGTQGHVDSITPLSYICEAGECCKSNLQLSQITQTAWVFCAPYIIDMDILKRHGYDIHFIFRVVLPPPIMRSEWNMTPLAQNVISRCLTPIEQVAGRKIRNWCCCTHMFDLFITVSCFR